jgi:hypothetical protein
MGVYSYDDLGRRTTLARGNSVANTSCGYDAYNRLTSAAGNVSLAYDPLGRLMRIVGSSTTWMLYDGVDMIAEISGGGAVLNRYVHGPGVDEPLVWYEGSGTSNRSWLLADERG